MFQGAKASEEARRRARYGHRDWIVWIEGGVTMAALATAETVKRAMLSSGTQGHFTLYHRSGTGSSLMNWKLAAGLFRNLRRQDRCGL